MSFVARKPWIWSYAATLIVWIITILFTGGTSAGGLSQAAFTFAAFSVLVGIGQMFVITLGPGNVDLSVPATMTLAGTLSLKYMDGGEGVVLAGLGIAILVGLAIGTLNYALIKLLRIPPIIATLSMSFIVQSTAIWSNRGLRVKPPESIANFTTSDIVGVPNIALVSLIVAVAAWCWRRASMAAGSPPLVSRNSPRAWPGSRLMARASLPTCSAPCSLLSAASCSRVSPAVPRSTWGPSIF
jgi:ribose transport system permease protein